MKHLTKIYLLSIILCIFFACEDPHKNDTYQVYNVNPISTYLESHPDDYSEWVSVLKYADLFNAINFANQDFTAFVPHNEAVKDFYVKKGVTSIEELGYDYARNLAQFHIIADSIPKETFTEGGRLEKPTLSDDYLFFTFTEGGYNNIYINQEAKIAAYPPRASNGFVYTLDAVLSPLTESLQQRISESKTPHTIMLKALELTSWKDSLSVIADTITADNGRKRIVKRKYTLLATSDEAFKKDGIMSIEDLTNKIGADNNYKDPKNALFKYIAYHIIQGSYDYEAMITFDSPADKTKIWNTKARNELLQVSLIDGQYFINYNGSKTSFLKEESDIVAKNGMMHQIDNYLPIWHPEPLPVLFDVCSYPDVASYIEANGKDQKYQTVDASNEYRTRVLSLPCYDVHLMKPASLKSYNELDYFTAKAGNAWKDSKYGDMLILNLGYTGSIAMETPAIIKGKYKVTLHFGFASSQDFMRLSNGGSNGGLMRFSFDNKNSIDAKPYTTVPSKTLGNYQYVLFDEVEFTETSSHEFKIVILDPAAQTNENFRIYIDYLMFEPI